MRPLLFIIAVSVSGSLLADDTDPASDQQKLLRLEIEKELRDDLEQSEAALEAKIAAELKQHREYLQSLDEKFYERIQIWVPIVSAVFAAIVAFFYWQVGKTRKEAFEATQATAVAKATELAERRVEDVITRERIVETATDITETTIEQIKGLKEELTKEVERELKEARDEVVSNKHEIIAQTLDEAIKDKFADELDVISRLEELETRFRRLEQQSVEVIELLTSIAGTEPEKESKIQGFLTEMAELTGFTGKVVEMLIRRAI